MINIRILLGERIATAFNRFHMQQHRTPHRFGGFQRLLQLIQIVTVHRTEIVESHLFVNGAVAVHHRFQTVFHPQQSAIARRSHQWNAFHKPFDIVLDPHIVGAGTHMRQMARYIADIAADRHTVVI